MIIQKLNTKCDSAFELAKRYYRIVFTINNLHVTESELNLVAFSAVHGTISTPPVRDEFVKQFEIPIVSVYNMSSKLQKLGIFIKDSDKKVRIHPSINLKFNDSVALVIKMENNGNQQVNGTGNDQTSQEVYGENSTGN